MPDLYHMPKLKLKKRKKVEVKVKGVTVKGAYMTGGNGKKLKIAPIKMKKKKMGRIIRIKTKGYSEPTLRELRMITNEAAKEGVEKMRMKREIYLRKTIKGLK